MEPLTWALAEMGRSHNAGEYLRAVEYAQSVTRRAAEWWAGGFDLMLTPTLWRFRRCRSARTWPTRRTR